MIKIVADTTSCLTLEEVQKRGIYYVPQIIVIGEETYRDDTEMNAIQFLERQRTSPILPKTAAPPPALYTPIFQEITEQGNSAIVLAPSTQVSGTYRGASVAAQDFPNTDIRIIDTQLIAGGLGQLVLAAHEWAEQGLSMDEILQRVEAMRKRHRVFFVVDTLDYLYKGGRIGTARHLIGSLLQMKPILTLQDGHVASFESQRTQKRALARLKEIVLSECPPGPESRLNIMHGDAFELARSLAEELGPALNIPVEQIPIYDLTPAILVHSGPGVIAISYYTKS